MAETDPEDPLDTQKRENILSYLESINIQHTTFYHPKADTIQQLLQYTTPYTKDNNAAVVKNLFFKDKKKEGVLFLIAAQHDTSVDLKFFSKEYMGVSPGNLRFAGEDDLKKVFNVSPGSVTPLAIYHDTESTVRVILDERMLEFEHVIVHPLTNNASTMIKSRDLLKFIDSLPHKHSVKIVRLSEV
eukprot:TRINITY_DN4861_c0_g1_i11.p1 TRINITY_DN4861_c0_g1~~TRINITY_DN4861_c0_g1_i11.p1  ORF type:complete len:187 (+),score=32.82 TRINITY_DN4861_c0_g1_i11:285-845(+)